MTSSRMILALLMTLTLQACGGGDDEEPAPEQSEMPCKYRPDCTAGPPVGSHNPEPPEPPASAASAV